jgi:hypothetical protein
MSRFPWYFIVRQIYVPMPVAIELRCRFLALSDGDILVGCRWTVISPKFFKVVFVNISQQPCVRMSTSFGVQWHFIVTQPYTNINGSSRPTSYSSHFCPEVKICSFFTGRFHEKIKKRRHGLEPQSNFQQVNKVLRIKKGYKLTNVSIRLHLQLRAVI